MSAKRRTWPWAGLAVLCPMSAVLPYQTALARPSAPAIVCAAYPNAGDCAGRVVNCTLCHLTVDPPAWNAFGSSIKSMVGASSFEATLPAVLAALETQDADGDGVSNRDELAAGTQPGTAELSTAAPDDEPATNPGYRLDGYDLSFAFRRVSTLYCGRSPSYEELLAFREGGEDAILRTRLHDTLARCLQSDYWQKTLLPRLADKRIKPLVAAGPDSKISIAG